jgi:hypothetical protein
MKVRDRAGSTFWIAAERVGPVFFSGSDHGDDEGTGSNVRPKLLRI